MIFQDVQSCQPTKESLSELLISFIQFQEKTLGKKASERSIRRFPMECFLDLRLGGALCHIFAHMYRHKREQNWTKFDFSLTDQNIQMSKEIFEKLIDQKCIRSPTIYIRPEISEDMLKRIENSLSNLRCEIAKEQDEATHIIYEEINDPASSSAESSTASYARPWFRRGQHIMVHWYYLPPSYNSWCENNFGLPKKVVVSLTLNLASNYSKN